MVHIEVSGPILNSIETKIWRLLCYCMFYHASLDSFATYGMCDWLVGCLVG